ncbi:CHAT domain-containing protein [Rhodohalobacter mucosus]|nr:CHAT domain-containing protein [Rhodohalobacter mucosus]
MLAAQESNNPDQLFLEAKQLFLNNEKQEADRLFRSYYRDRCTSPENIERCAETEIYLGSITRSGGEYDQAEEFYTLARSRITDSREQHGSLLVWIYSQLFYLEDELENISLAESWVNKALELVDEEQMNGVPAARAYLANGSLQITLGNYQDAVDAFELALDQIHTDPESDNYETKRLLSQGYTNMGIAYGRLGLYDSALRQYENARQIILDTFGSQDREMALIYNSLGSISYFSGDHGTAAQYFLRSGSILSDIHGEIHEGVAIAYNNAGSSFMSLGDIVSATEYLEKAQQIKESLYGFENFDIAVGYNNLAYLYVQREEYGQAEEYYRLSIEIREKLFDKTHPSLTAPLLQLSSMYIQIENYSEARELLERVVEIAELRLDASHPDAIEAMMLIASSYMAQGQLDDAERGYIALINLLTENALAGDGDFLTVQPERVRYPVKLVESIRGYTATLYSKYLSNLNEGALTTILDAAELASRTIDFLQTTYQSEASKLNLLDKNHDIYATAIDAIYELYSMNNNPDRIDQMVYYSEKSRARIAMEYLQTVEARNFGSIPQEVIDDELKLNLRVTELFQRVNLEKEKGDEADSVLVGTLTDSLFHARRELQEFTAALEHNYPSYFELKYKQHIAGITDIQSFLSEDETAILYSFGRNHLYATVLGKNSKSLHKLDVDTGESVTGQINSLRSTLETGNREEYRQQAYLLYEQLFAPLRPDIRSESLILLPDQVLQYLPFELLLTDESEASEPDHELPFLIREFDFRYSPSATVMLSERSAEEEGSPQNLLALAPFEQDGVSYSTQTEISRAQNSLGALPLTGYEAREIASLFRQRDTAWNFFFPEQAEVLTGRRASKNRVLTGVMDDYGFIHFATHAFIHETNPSLSGIALHRGDDENGMVYISDIYNLRMNADLVVLGACETGLGELHRGEGLIGFTRAFFFAGVSNLVVSMWKVDDQSTANLMVNFYRNIRNDNMDYAAALRNAKLELINHPEYAFPSNWAAFILNVRQ